MTITTTITIAVGIKTTMIMMISMTVIQFMILVMNIVSSLLRVYFNSHGLG